MFQDVLLFKRGCKHIFISKHILLRLDLNTASELQSLKQEGKVFYSSADFIKDDFLEVVQFMLYN